MANPLPKSGSYGLVTIGFGLLTFGGLLAALLFMLDMTDTDKDVRISQDHGQYWLGIPAFILGIYVLFTRNQVECASKYIRLCVSAYCFVASVICIVLEAPDWMRYLSDNRSPDLICKQALIAIPGLQKEMDDSDYLCSRRSSYAWTIGFIMVSAVCLINFSICSTLIHVWIAIREQIVYKMPDYPAFTCAKMKNRSSKKKKQTGSTNDGFEAS